MSPLVPTAANHSLIHDHVYMALKIARRLAYRLPESVSREDVEGAALLGLTEAAYRYDTSREEPFMAFASKRVRGAILDHLRSIDPMSRRGRREARRLTEVAHRLECVYGRAVSTAEVAEELGISEDDVHEIMADVQAACTVSVDEVVSFATGVSVETPNESIERQQLRTALVCALETLNPRSVMILSLYYLEGLSLREIGESIGVTESRVCQLRAEALRVLRLQLM